MRALITGSEGFVGPYLSELLLKNNFEVYGTYLTTPTTIVDIHQIQTDITQKEDAKNAVKESKPDFVFHLAGFSSVGESWKKPELCRQINVEGTRNLLDAIKESNTNPRILIISSSEVYGIPKENPIPETHTLNPISPYAKSRVEQEQLATKYDLDLVISRSFNHTGPRQPKGFVVPDIASQIASIESGKTPPTIEVGNTDAIRDFTDVRDIVKAYLTALQKAPKGTYNIASGKGTQIKTIIETLISFSNTNINLHKNPEKTRPLDTPIRIGDPTKIQQTTNWKPTTPLKKTLKDTLKYWRQKQQ
ncbi:GDP-mannose 4,6-dehydratase [uncultured archaeon]|nr:GDP-mannose 4,6-dehydratase [uncultured archaeon]